MISFILLFGALECFLLAFLFLRMKGKIPGSNYLLGIIFLIFSLDFLFAYYLESALYQRFSAFLLLDNFFALIQTPLIYLLCLFLCQRSWKKTGKAGILLFLPAILYLTIATPFWFMDASAKDTFLHQESLYGLVILLFDFLVIPIQYLYFYRKMSPVLKEYRGGLKDIYSSMAHKKLHWFKGLVLLLGTVYLLYILQSIASQWVRLPAMVEDYFFLPLYVFFLLYIQIISYKLLLQPQMVFEISPGKESPAPSSVEDLEEIQRIALKAEKFLEEDQTFLDPELTLGDLAKSLGVSLHSLSKAINQHFKKNFFDFVNRYRVEYIQGLFRDKPDIRILEAAFEGGFNSKSSFNLVFKKQTGQTPSEYRKQLDLAKQPVG